MKEENKKEEAVSTGSITLTDEIIKSTGSITLTDEIIKSTGSITFTDAIITSEYSFKLVLPLNMKWEPKEDITAYELALCIPYIYRSGLMPFEVDETLPHFRHFKITNPNK